MAEYLTFSNREVHQGEDRKSCIIRAEYLTLSLVSRGFNINQINTMFTKSIGAECKSLYTSPLAEEIIVSFEERFLDATNPGLTGPVTGDPGTAGYHDGFQGRTYDNI